MSRNYKTKRRAASRKKARILELKGKICHWCKCELVSFSELSKTCEILNLQNYTLQYRDENKEVKTGIVATLDHVLELHRGGGNSIDNLVPSCYNCNKERSKINKRQGE